MLDVGCGIGWFICCFVCLFGMDVVGVDINVEWLVFVCIWDYYMCYLDVDVFVLLFVVGSFDYVILVIVFGFILDWF